MTHLLVLPSLPAELILQIGSFLPFADLAEFLLAKKRIYRILNPALYHTINVKTLRCTRLLARTAESNPEILQFCKHFLLCIPYDRSLSYDEGDIRDALHCIAVLLGVLASTNQVDGVKGGLKTLHWQFGFRQVALIPAQAWICIGRMGPSLHDARLYFGRWDEKFMVFMSPSISESPKAKWATSSIARCLVKSSQVYEDFCSTCLTLNTLVLRPSETS